MVDSNHPERLAELPNYRVRESKKAKHVCIKVSLLGDVEVVVPKGFNQRHLPEILLKRQDWIIKTTQRILAERQSIPSEVKETRPETIELRSLSETWIVQYRSTASSGIEAVVQPKNKLVIQGQIANPDACKQVLRQWLSRYARHRFEPWLWQTSQALELPFEKISIRGQKTRWASCSSQKSISLNYKLLFLPAPLVRYVFVHELCHTIHLNHSDRFWALVEDKEPGYKKLDLELRGAWRYVPEWIEHLAN